MLKWINAAKKTLKGEGKYQSEQIRARADVMLLIVSLQTLLSVESAETERHFAEAKSNKIKI